MTEQDDWNTHEAQLEPLLPILSEPGTHYRGLQEFLGPFRSASPRRKVEAVVAPF